MNLKLIFLIFKKEFIEYLKPLNLIKELKKTRYVYYGIESVFISYLVLYPLIGFGFKLFLDFLIIYIVILILDLIDIKYKSRLRWRFFLLFKLN